MTRTRISRVGLVALILVLSALVLAACGDTEEDGTATTEAVTTSSEAATNTTVATATTLGGQSGLSGPFVINLSGEEEVPPVQTDASGTFTLELGTGTGTDSTDSATGTTAAGGGAGTVTSDTTSGMGTDTTASTGGAGAGGLLGGMSINWTLEVENITDATAAHIHLGAPGENGPVLITLYGGPQKEGEFSGMLAEGTLTLADIQAVEGRTPEEIIGLIQSGGTYVNVHTVQNPNGEIRGQVVFMQDGSGTSTTMESGTDTTGTTMGAGGTATTSGS
jgi:hypothetical protein